MGALACPSVSYFTVPPRAHPSTGSQSGPPSVTGKKTSGGAGTHTPTHGTHGVTGAHEHTDHTEEPHNRRAPILRGESGARARAGPTPLWGKRRGLWISDMRETYTGTTDCRTERATDAADFAVHFPDTLIARGAAGGTSLDFGGTDPVPGKTGAGGTGRTHKRLAPPPGERRPRTN